ncbi:MAG: NAD(P)-dependent alcohol dehydrogenase [Woeseia sp.]|nr:NAD(P)-dependent alcohol dehydrogenase [Woeseia sp.]NNL55826.1 NAD(P)-dependent alcohol dehydrogenase [Woeseia sp.]
MKAIVYRCYGSADVLNLEDIQKPTPADDEALVKVHAAAVNPLDWHYMRGTPYFMRLLSGIGKPDITRLGVDFAGTIEAVGKNVKAFKPGDEVFGGRTGAFADYLIVRETSAVVPKPADVTFEQAAALPIAAVTALQALRDKGKLQRGQKVLINGASGGVGTYAVQIAKSMGAEVTGVCSTRNVDMVLSLGADQVIDYKKENYIEQDIEYDLIIDNVGNNSLMANRRVLTPNGTLVMVGGSSGDWIGPLLTPLQALIMSPFVEQKFEMLLAEINHEDLNFLANLLHSGKMNSVIDRRYSLSELPDAIRYSEEGHARGKILIDMQ